MGWNWIAAIKSWDNEDLLTLVSDYDFLQKHGLQKHGYLGEIRLLRQFINRIRKAHNFDESLTFTLLANDVNREALRELVKRSYGV